MEEALRNYMNTSATTLNVLIVLGVIHGMVLAGFLTALAVAAHKFVSALDRKWQREANARDIRADADRLNAPFKR